MCNALKSLITDTFIQSKFLLLSLFALIERCLSNLIKREFEE